MSSKKVVDPIISGAGWIAGFLGQFLDGLREQGVSDQQIHELCKPEGKKIIGIWAKILAQPNPSPFQPILEFLINSSKLECSCDFFTRIALDINEILSPIDLNKIEFVKIQDFTNDYYKWVNGPRNGTHHEEMIKMLASAGYRPVGLFHLLCWWMSVRNGRDMGDYCYIPLLSRTKRSDVACINAGGIGRGYLHAAGAVTYFQSARFPAIKIAA